jgi:hypothetical protein
MPAQIGRILKLDRLRLRGPVARAPLLASALSLHYGVVDNRCLRNMADRWSFRETRGKS